MVGKVEGGEETEDENEREFGVENGPRLQIYIKMGTGGIRLWNRQKTSSCKLTLIAKASQVHAGTTELAIIHAVADVPVDRGTHRIMK